MSIAILKIIPEIMYNIPRLWIDTNVLCNVIYTVHQCEKNRYGHVRNLCLLNYIFWGTMLFELVQSNKLYLCKRERHGYERRLLILNVYTSKHIFCETTSFKHVRTWRGISREIKRIREIEVSFGTGKCVHFKRGRLQYVFLR